MAEKQQAEHRLCICTTAASLYQSAEQLANDPNIFRKTNKFKTAIDDLREATDATIQTERANALNDVENIRARIHDSTEYQHATQAAQTKVETELDQVAERMQRIPFIYKMRESVHELSECTYPQLINALATSAPRPKTALADEAQTPSTTPTDTNIPESWQEETPRVAVSFATISRPHTKDAWKPRMMWMTSLMPTAVSLSPPLRMERRSCYEHVETASLRNGCAPPAHECGAGTA